MADTVPPSTLRLHAVVSGIVQGVSFRYYTLSLADSLRLTGWVRNRPDGTVETVAEGAAEDVEHFAAWLKHGPPLARVSAVHMDWLAATGEFNQFSVTA